MADSITVWYIIGRLNVGGAEKTLIELVTELDRERFDPTIWTIRDPGPLASEVPKDVPVRPLNASGKLDPSVPIAFAHELRREQPEILQSFLYFDNVLARISGIASPKTDVVTGVRDVPNELPVHRDLADRVTVPLSDAIVSNSHSGAEWIIDRGADQNRVHIVHNGRRIEEYDVSPQEDYCDEIENKEGPIVGTVGRLIERKGHHELIEAWPHVLEEHPDTQLLIVGDGEEYDALRKRVHNLNIQESVHLLGQRDDIPQLLALFDVFVFPSHHEGLPGALLEAMCAEVPIVTTPVDGCAELVTAGKHGLHVPTKDPPALAEAINHLLSERTLAKSLAKNAKRKAQEEFTIAQMVSGFEDIYERIAGTVE